MTTYSYDGRNLLSWLVNPFAERTTWLYDALGRVTTMTHANASFAQHDYDAAGRITALRNLKSDRSVLSIFSYSYDSIGNRTGVTEANGDLVTWSYDETYQLTREQRSGANAYDITYTYDPAGNRLTKLEGGVTTTYAYDEANQLLTSEGASGLTTFTYDANGNTTGEVRPNGDRVTYTWDVENMLTQAALPAGATSTFVYDGDRRLRSKTEAADTVNLIRDLERVLVEADANWATVARYTVRGGGWLDPLLAMRRGDASSFYHLDALGSADRLTDIAQATSDAYLYRAFGLDTVLSGITTNPYRFVAAFGYYKTAVSLLHLGARYYQALTGRFLSSDRMPWAPNGYGYGANSPLRRVDPMGLQWTVPGNRSRGGSWTHCQNLLSRIGENLAGATKPRSPQCKAANDDLFDFEHQCSLFHYDLRWRYEDLGHQYNVKCRCPGPRIGPAPERPYEGPWIQAAPEKPEWQWPGWPDWLDWRSVAAAAAQATADCQGMGDPRLPAYQYCWAASFLRHLAEGP